MSKSETEGAPFESAQTPEWDTPEQGRFMGAAGQRLGSQPTLTAEAGVSALGDTMAPPSGTPTGPLPTTGKFPVLHWERYEFLQLLGKGGMGAVYKARDPRLDRLIALKFIHSSDDQMILRFMQEARAQARIDHPGICQVHEVGEVEGKAYIAMQFIDGPSLQQAAKQLSMPDKAQVIRDAALALHAAHELGIIHRDIKPAKERSEGRGRRTFPPPPHRSQTALGQHRPRPFYTASAGGKADGLRAPLDGRLEPTGVLYPFTLCGNRATLRDAWQPKDIF